MSAATDSLANPKLIIEQYNPNPLVHIRMEWSIQPLCGLWYERERHCVSLVPTCLQCIGSSRAIGKMFR